MEADETETEAPITEDSSTEENVQAIPKAKVLLEDAGRTVSQSQAEEAEDSDAVNTKYQWIHVTSSVSEGEGNAKVCLTLTEHESKAAATKVKLALFAKQPEDFSSIEISDWAQLNAPVILEGACSQTENLNVNYTQDYQRNENGEYITDENGNLNVTARYLEYEVPAGSSTDFYAAIAYSQEEEAYTYVAELTAQVTWKVDGENLDILEKEEKNQIAITLEKKAEDAENTEDTEATEKEALVQVSLTKELEEEENTGNPDEPTNEDSDNVAEETAVSGQAYAVHVTAQDLHQDSEGDITVRLDMKDTDTGLPLQGISTSFGKTKEEALSGENADNALIPEGVNGQELNVSRIQESTEDENGEASLTSDYIDFQLPAGETADFYIGITYTAQEEEYQSSLIMEAQAQQLIAPESDENTEDMLAALPGALTTEFGEDIAETGADEAALSESTEEEKTVDVLNGTAAVMLAWAARSAGGNRPLQAGDWLYFDVTNSGNWEQASAVISLSYGSGINASMTKCKQDHLYKIKLTQEMAESTWFKFNRGNSEEIWNWMPQANGSNLHFNENHNSNVFRASSFTDGSWDEGIWLTFNYAGEKLYFINQQQGAAQEAVTASFSVDEDSTVAANDVPMDSDPTLPGLYFTTIPDCADYDTVTFKNGDITYTKTKILEADYNPDTTNTFYFAASEIGSNEGKQIYSGWGTLPGNESIAGKKLYLDNTDTAFPANIPVTIQIGAEASETLAVDTESNMYLYTVPETSDATQQTLITMTAGDKIYRLFWSDIKKNKVTVTDNIAAVTGKYRNGYTVYYDATLSKMSYAGSGGLNNGQGIPYNDTNGVYYYAVKSDNTTVVGAMSSVENSNGNLWSVDLSPNSDGIEYTKIRFAGYNVADEQPATNGDGTDLTDIPWDFDTPCYYGDDSDDVIYKGGNRGGYWDEKGSVRDAERGKKSTVVNVPSGTFTSAPDTLYVDSTFYDYYTDYELNGNNRDSYDLHNPIAGSQRSYVTFRQFDQALSDYYQSNNIVIPIYTGHFQPDYDKWGTPFSEIADTLKLFGYDKNNQSGFMSTNNSTLNANGNSTYYDAAAQGLVSNILSNGNLMAAGGNAQEPHFNESFLSGNNSKNTVLGNIYHNVSFPFTKQKLDINGNKCDGNVTNVDYWYFDSADTTLAMRQDGFTGEYYLQNTGNQGWSQNVNSSSQAGAGNVSNTYGFFPFNENTIACSASNYNYGFGTKLEFKFRLTEDGMVIASDGKTEFPIQFTFSGDDDVWVYVDGKLALDVGGAHGRVTGTIDFRGNGTTKTATVSRTKVSQGSSTEGSNITNRFEISGSNTSEHTLTMFYMERGMWESNMKVSFNFLDENQLQVEKRVDKSGVNKLFSNLFENMSMFNFSIRNLATHYGEKEVATGSTTAVRVSDKKYTLVPSHQSNTFETVSSGDFSGAVHWYAKETDQTSSYRDLRYGDLTLTESIDISNMAYLEFKFYYDYADTPSLSNMYLQLVDNAGHVAGDIESTESLSGRTYGSVTPKDKNWITVKLDFSKLSWTADFDKNNLTKIRFGYNYPRDIYLRDFVFQPTATYTGTTGFVTKQYEIPDYGSSQTGKLVVPEGATYTSSNGNTYRIGGDGTFVLQDKETITFKDQFRRGSYIYLKEEADPDLFETTWTMYENGQAVTRMNTGNTVTNSSVTTLSNVSGSTVEDGRTEKCEYGTDSEGKVLKNEYDGTKPSDNTFVFRSYTDPDNTTGTTKLKAVFYNKVKTGSLKLKKSPAYPSDGNRLKGTYDFKITYSNVGGMGLETEPIIQNISLTLDGTGNSAEKVITGIPIGTFFSIEELTPGDGSSLDSITMNGIVQESGTTIVNGDINSSVLSAEVEFKNTMKPLVNVSVQKLWKYENGDNYTGTLPEKIYVQLQRKNSSEADSLWNGVEYNGKAYTEITHNIYTNKWDCSFTGLDKYVDYTQESPVEWLYRVVEVKVSKSGDSNESITETVTPIEQGNVIELSAGKFAVTYTASDGIYFSKDESSGKETETEIITNTYQPPKTTIQLLKIEAGTAGENLKKLSDATFSIEKLQSDGTVDNSSISSQTTDKDGLATFENLDDGTYRITETKAPDGYSLLKSPITVVINRRDNSITVDGGENVFNKLSGDIITIQVADQKKFQIPATGSWSRLILGFSGAILMGMSVIMYLLQKRRKGGKTS